MSVNVIRLTKAQRNRIFACGVGVGVVVYKSADHEVTEFEFYLDSKNRMRFVGNGALVDFKVTRDEDGWETSATAIPSEPQREEE